MRRRELTPEQKKRAEQLEKIEGPPFGLGVLAFLFFVVTILIHAFITGYIFFAGLIGLIFLYYMAKDSYKNAVLDKQNPYVAYFTSVI
ncbi:hypothetical protein GF367_00400, partial [Candidatus Woesearchaeota archaeon]|nr:hypothetical protein [Candidatus Woesearchaeota archaeon]